MSRSLFDLLKARRAGDELTAEEQEILRGHDQQTSAINEHLAWRVARTLTPEEIEHFQPTGLEFDEYRASVVDHVATMSLEEARTTIAELLYIIRNLEGRLAERTGKERGQRRRAAHESIDQRRLRGLKLVQAITKRQKQSPDRLEKDLVRDMLGERRQFATLTHEEQEKDVAATLRRLQRARARKANRPTKKNKRR